MRRKKVRVNKNAAMSNAHNTILYLLIYIQMLYYLIIINETRSSTPFYAWE